MQTYSNFIPYPKEIMEKVEHLGDNSLIRWIYDRAIKSGGGEEAAIMEGVLAVDCRKASKAYREGSPEHFFFSGPDFLSWLERCKTPFKNEQFDAAYQLLSNVGKPVILHFHGGNSPAIYAALSEFTGAIPYIFFFCGYGKTAGLLNREEDSNLLADLHPAHMDALSLLSSALAYVLAFPEMVYDGLPPDLKHIGWYKGTAKTVSVSPTLIDHSSPCPHFRIGHFRVLSSERFKVKKGQTIFVKGTFVKGTAKTVEGIE